MSDANSATVTALVVYKRKGTKQAQAPVRMNLPSNLRQEGFWRLVAHRFDLDTARLQLGVSFVNGMYWDERNKRLSECFQYSASEEVDIRFEARDRDFTLTCTGMHCTAKGMHNKPQDKSFFAPDQWRKKSPKCKACVPGRFTIVGGSSLDQSMLDGIGAHAHPRASKLTKRALSMEPHAECVSFPLKIKRFRGSDRVSTTYHQVAHSCYLMKDLTGLAPQLEGQCFMPVITWIAGNIKITSATFRDYATDVSSSILNDHIIGNGYYLERETKANAGELFMSGAPGMYMILCELVSGHLHYIGYDGWRGVIYEPLGNELVGLDANDLEKEKDGTHPIRRLRQHLDIKCFKQVHQLWKQK